MRASKQQTGIKVKKTKGKRVSLRCPLSIERTDLEYNFDTSALQVCMTVENMGGGGMASDTVESAVIVLRVFDKDGKALFCKTNDYFAKLLRFGEEGLASGGRITFRLLPDHEGATRAEDVEIYISRVRYTDGTVTDYVRGDFFDLPGEGVLLAKKFKKNPDEAEAALGEGATYVPEHLTEIVWRCTCGEFSESDSCPTCGRKKSELFAALDALLPQKAGKKATAVILPVGEEKKEEPKSTADEGADGQTAAFSIAGLTSPAGEAPAETAEYSTDAAKAALAAMRAEAGLPPEEEENGESTDAAGSPWIAEKAQDDTKMRNILLAAISAASVVLLIILLLIILTLCGNREEPGASGTTDAGISNPDNRPNGNEAIVREYLAQGQYDNALGLALASDCSDELINEIYDTAIQAYTAAGNLDKALEWATKKGDAAAIDNINLLRFSEKLSAGDYPGALELVPSLPADRQPAASASAAEAYVNALVKEGKFTQAMAIADQYKTATTSAMIAESAVQNHVKVGEFDEAIALAEQMNLPAQIASAASAATDHYIAAEDYDRAADYVGMTGDADKMKTVLDQLTDAQVRRHLPTFFALLSFAEMQQAHSSLLSAKPQTVAAIDSVGSVYLGDKLIYNAETVTETVDPDSGEPVYDSTFLPAVSVSCCDTAVVILLSDGTVRIAESTNSFYSADDVTGWSDIVAISAGNYHLLGLTKDGTVVAVGSNVNGQCAVSELADAVAVAAGDNHSLILHKNGKVTALGSNIAGICNTADWEGIIAISAGTLHSIGLKSDGTVVALGNCNVTGWSDVVALFSSATNAVALKSDGTLLCSVSGKASDLLSDVDDALWVSVGKQGFSVLHRDGTLTATPIGSAVITLPSTWKTEAFGTAE